MEMVYSASKKNMYEVLWEKIDPEAI